MHCGRSDPLAGGGGGGLVEEVGPHNVRKLGLTNVEQLIEAHSVGFGQKRTNIALVDETMI